MALMTHYRQHYCIAVKKKMARRERAAGCIRYYSAFHFLNDGVVETHNVTRTCPAHISLVDTDLCLNENSLLEIRLAENIVH